VDADILLVFVILGGTVLLVVTEWFRYDVIALLVLGTLALTGLVTAEEALSGFSNPAVLTVWAMLILSAGLARTGVAQKIGGQLSRVTGTSEWRIILLIMIVAGVLSGFMNNIGVTALFLPIVVDLAKTQRISSSRLLIPLAFASLLGGLNTLIGTPPNLLISQALDHYGLEPFGMFAYTPTGLVVIAAGILYMLLVGRHLLPKTGAGKALGVSREVTLRQMYDLEERTFILRLPLDSKLAGKTLEESRLGPALGLNVIAIHGLDATQASPDARSILSPGDWLLVSGKQDKLLEISEYGELLVNDQVAEVDWLVSGENRLAELTPLGNSTLVGQTIEESDFRSQYGLNVLAISQAGAYQRSNLQTIPIAAGDVLLVFGPQTRLAKLEEQDGHRLRAPSQQALAYIQEHLIEFQVPVGSSLVGKTMPESRLGQAFNLSVIRIFRQGQVIREVVSDTVLQAEDRLVVVGELEDLRILIDLQAMSVEEVSTEDLESLDNSQVGLVEMILSPHTTLGGKTLRQINFREKYGLTVLAIWRDGRAHHANLRDMTLKFGDGLLVYGPRQKLALLAGEPDFLVLSGEIQEPPRMEKAPYALGIMVLILLPVLFGWLPISITAMVGVVLMVITGCLTMDEAYRSVEWKAIILIAGMLPLGIALEKTGAAQAIADGLVGAIGGYRPTVAVVGFFCLAAISSQIMPNAAVAVLLAPIAYNSAMQMGISPYALLMTVAVSASAAFLSPIGHAVNIMVMAPGGYQFKDYLRVGLPLTLVTLLALLLVLPLVWPY
jgi:di/tricarboxylate transporter